MHHVHAIAARPFGFGPIESIVVLVLLLVLFSEYAFHPEHGTGHHAGRLTRKESLFVAVAGLILAAAIALLLRS